jgi:hypothetical protein
MKPARAIVGTSVIRQSVLSPIIGARLVSRLGHALVPNWLRAFLYRADHVFPMCSFVRTCRVPERMRASGPDASRLAPMIRLLDETE